MGQLDQREATDDEAARDQIARIDPRHEQSDDRHQEDDREASERQDLAGELRGVPEKQLQKLRDQDDAAVEDCAEREHERRRDCKVAIFEQPQIDHGMRLPPLPEDEHDQQRDRHDRQDDDLPRGEPVMPLARVGHHLKRSKRDPDHGEAHEIDALAGRLFTGPDQMGRIFDHPVRQVQREHADGNVHEEDPAPREVIRDVSPKRRADGWRQHHGHAVHGKRHPALLRGKGVGEDGLFAWRQPAAADALQHAEEDEQAERRSEPAQKAAGREQRHARHVEILPAESLGKPCRNRQHHCVRDEV